MTEMIHVKKSQKWGALILAALLAFGLWAGAVAEETSAPPAETGETAAPQEDAAAEDTAAQAEALKEALEAWQNARGGSKKRVRPDTLKQELDSLVAAGKLTQAQADLIQQYYADRQASRKGSPAAGQGRREKKPDSTPGQEPPQSGTFKGKRRPQNSLKPGETQSGSSSDKAPAAKAQPDEAPAAGTQPDAAPDAEAPAGSSSDEAPADSSPAKARPGKKPGGRKPGSKPGSSGTESSADTVSGATPKPSEPAVPDESSKT